MLRILIADDHAVVRSGLRQFLAEEDDLGVAGEASSGAEVFALLKAEHWDLLLLDISLPDMNGIEILKRVKREVPSLPVLMFSMYSEDDHAMASLEAGAAGYLPKDSEPARVLDAIRRACNRERYLTPEFAEKLISGRTRNEVRRPHEKLSARELEIMILMSSGKRLSAIADLLHLSPKTVSTHRARVLEKMGLENNVELVRYVIENKLDL
jgi:two-component system, NarL family, invasion response regulator UvrY